jgi:hypothetical protein
MPDRFIYHAAGAPSSPFATWADAAATGSAVDAIDTAGDRWLFDYRHSESTAGAVTLIVAGTPADPSQLLSVTQTGGAGISALTAGAVIATTGASTITMRGSFYAYGIKLQAGSSTSNASINMTNAGAEQQVYESCQFVLAGNNSGGRIAAGWAATSVNVEWLGCDVSFSNASQAIAPSGKFVWRGGSILSGSASPATTGLLVPSNSRVSSALVDGVDLSNGGSGMNLIASSIGGGEFRAVFRNCKLPASWSGAMFAGAVGVSMRGELRSCSAGDVNYALWVEDYAGSIKHETTLVKTGGASDGTTPLSWVMASSANAEYPAIILRSPEIQKWNETTGSAITVTVDFLHDSATNLQDDEIWLEVEYLGTSGFPLAVFVDDAAADVIATPADQTTSAATWTTTGMSNPNEQKMSVTFTPQEKGLIIARVCVGLASKTVYIDPVLQVS